MPLPDTDLYPTASLLPGSETRAWTYNRGLSDSSSSVLPSLTLYPSDSLYPGGGEASPTWTYTPVTG